MERKINCVEDVILHANDIIQNIGPNWTNDQVIILNASDANIGFVQKSCVAGSKAVVLLSEMLRVTQKKILDDGNHLNRCGPYLKLIDHFKSNDTDVFFLDSEKDDRVSYDNVDIIHLKTKTIDSLLLNFDLPNCRAAYCKIQNKTVFFVSLHCLYSMLTGCYFLPTYLKDRDEFVDIVKKHRNGVNTHNKHIENKLFNRLHQRIQKYKDRGYTCRYVKTDHVQPWILNRFCYEQFSVMTTPDK